MLTQSLSFNNLNTMKPLYYKTCQSPLGPLGLLASDKGLKQIFWNIPNTQVLPSQITQRVKTGSRSSILKKTVKELMEYFHGQRRRFSVPLDIQEGTHFQQKAWWALRQIPYGQVISYCQQAKLVDCPKGARAIGNANGKNPIPIIVPCHRVVHKSSDMTQKAQKPLSIQYIGGFTGGIEKKVFLLKLEHSVKYH